MKKIWNGLKIAFSMYSKIPMPQSEWTEGNMSFALCFFPLIGAVVGALTLLFRCLFRLLGMTESPFSAIVLMFIPVFVTGGIHLDGLLDTADALGSYGDREKRLEILKDSRVGAAAVIRTVIYFFCYYGVYSDLDMQPGQQTDKGWQVIALSFILSRALSSYGVVAFPKAKNTGLLASFSSQANKRAVKISMIVYGVVTAVLMGIISPVYALAVYVFAFFIFFWYYHMAVKKFGGITGDLAGWFLQNCELAMAFAVMIVYVLGGNV